MIFKRKGKILLGVFLAMSLLVFGASCSDDEDDEPSISIAGETTVAAGSEITLTATKNNFSSTISWTVATGSDYAEIKESSDTSCVVKGIKAGTATIRASAAGATRDYAVTVTGEASGGTGVYADFANYPTGKQNSTGTLTLKNQVNSKVLVFTDSVAPANYIGTIPAQETIKVKLTAGKFYNIVAVQQSVYEENPELAAQTSKLAYYSDTQAYTVSVSPDNLTGSATWVFNNNTNYWVSVEHVDNSGETFAVIAPNAKRVSIPVQTNNSYPYKIVYKKELKYNNMTIAVAEKTAMAENDEASFYNLTTFTTDINGTATANDDDLAPCVQFINNTGKTIRVYNGQVQLTDAGISTEDYTLASGITAYFTAFTAETSSTSLNVRSVSWNGAQSCTQNVTFQKGKVYVVTATPNTDSTTSATNPVSWNVVEKTASEFYEE
ncbi:MAG: hypothetical protein K6B43_13525 [Treponema sp.]|nr:hypothetical protein [Treponema sp.]